MEKIAWQRRHRSRQTARIHQSGPLAPQHLAPTVQRADGQEQPARRRGHFVDGRIERRDVRPGRLAITADLANELQCRRLNLHFGHVALRTAKLLDTAAHGQCSLASVTRSSKILIIRGIIRSVSGVRKRVGRPKSNDQAARLDDPWWTLLYYPVLVFISRRDVRSRLGTPRGVKRRSFVDALPSIRDTRPKVSQTSAFGLSLGGF